MQGLKILNFIFSILLGVVGGFCTRNYTKYSKLIGIAIALLIYYINKKLLSTDTDK